MKCNIGATYMKFSPMLASVNLCTTHVRCLNNAIDSRVTLTGDFVGIKPSSDTMFSKKEKNPVVAIAKLQEELHLNQRLKAHSFVTSILQPLEKKQEPFCSILKNSADSYAPAILKMCGLGMTDIPAENRMLILRQLIKGMVSNGIKLSMGGINAMVQVWIENDHKFDVQELLRFVENDLKLKLDSKFFSLCAWQLARQGDYDALVNWTNHMRSYGGFEPSDSDVDLALIFCAENRGDVGLSNELLQRYLSRFSIDDTAESISVLEIAMEKINENPKVRAHSAAVQGAAYAGDLKRVRQLIEECMLEFNKPHSTPTIGLPESTFPVVYLPQDVIFNVIWMLAKKHNKNGAFEVADFTNELLTKVLRNAGFFKLLFAQTERHIVGQFYHTAIAILADTNRIRGYLARQSRKIFVRHAFGKLAKQLVKNNVPISDMKEISEKVVSIFGQSHRFYDELMYAILTYRYASADKRFEWFAAFVNAHDPKREYMNVILPLITRVDSYMSRCKLLYVLTSMGYWNFSELDAHTMHKKIYLPIMYKFATTRNYSDSWDAIGDMVDYLNTFGIPKPELWRMCYSLLNNLSRDPLYISQNLHKLESWLRNNTDMLKADKSIMAVNPLKERVRVNDILQVLIDKVDENTEISELIELAYELKRRYPYASLDDSKNVATRLFLNLACSQTLTMKRVDEIMQFLTVLIKLNFVVMYPLEMISPDFVYRVLLDLGWDTAVETWMRFQTSFQCSNGIIELLKFIVRKGVDQAESEARFNYVFHKASNFILPNRVKAIYAGVLVASLKIDEAEKYLQQCDPKLDYQDFQFALALIISRCARLNLRRMCSELPAKFGGLAFDYAKQGYSSKIFFAEHILWYTNRWESAFAMFDLWDLFQQHDIKLPKICIGKSRETADLLQQNIFKWMVKSDLLNRKNAYPILNSKMIEINERKKQIGSYFYCWRN